MSQVLEKLDRLTMMAERLEGLARTMPRLAEMFGVAYLAGKASERLGGDFATGALGGAVADGLAHSRIPNNQIGGIALGAYFAALGVLTIAPTGGLGEPVGPDFTGGGTALGPAGVGMGTRTITTTGPECFRMGGVVIQAIRDTPYVVCRLPEE